MRMMVGQAGDQMTGFGIDPLIDGFVAQDGMSLFFGKDSGDNFRGPFHTEHGFDFLFKGFSFKAFSAMAFPHSSSGDKLRMERVVMLPSEIAPEFAGQ